MLSFINSWTSGIVVAVIIGSIIEMVLPENNNKKYIKTVVGLFVLFTIISPVIAKFAGGIDLSSITKYEEYIETSTKPISTDVSLISDDEIERVYKDKMRTDIETNLQQLGYEATNIQISIDTTEENYGNITEISLQVTLKEKGVETIKKVDINISGEEKKEEKLNEKDKQKIIDYLNLNYSIPKDKIYIN